MTQTQLPPPPPPVLPPAPWKTCPHCRALAQTLDSKCPHCGKGYKKRTVLKVMLALALTGVAFIVGCAALIGGAANEYTSTDGGSSSQTFSPSKGDGADDSPSEAAPTFKNGVLTTPDVKIRITRAKVIGAGQKGNAYTGKPIIAFWYKITNLSGADVDTSDFFSNFTVYQDNNPNAENELDLGDYSDDRYLHSELETIKKGGTVENVAAFALDDLRTPVDLVATDGLDEFGKATYKLR